MKFIPTAISRKVADQAFLGRKHSPTILLGVGLASMVGSTVLACRATLKLEEVLETAENDLEAARGVRKLHPDKYSEKDRKQDVAVIYVRGVVGVVKLYGPAIILGGVGIACLTKSHKILQDRNMALTAAYVAVDTAFRNYRQRVIDTYGEETDREMRYESEQVTVIDDETGKAFDTVRVAPGLPSGYARWFDESNRNWNAPPFDNNNFFFIRTQQNWANDQLRGRGHVFLNEVYSMLGLPHTNAGAIVGWIYDRNNERGDNYINFGCFDENHTEKPLDFFNGRDGAILLDFNVDGPIWDMMDAINEAREAVELEERNERGR